MQSSAQPKPPLAIITPQKEWDYARKHIDSLQQLNSGYKMSCKHFPGSLLHSFMYFSDNTDKKLLVRFARHYLLGRGAFGRVKIVEDENGNKYALKVLKTKLSTNEELILKKLGYLYFTGSNGPEEAHPKQYILLKLFDGFNVRDYLSTVGLNKSQKLALAYYLVKAVKDVHDIHKIIPEDLAQERIIHGDLKFDNLIIYETEEKQLAIAVVDFGSAQLLKPYENEYRGTSTGCSYYRAPEAKGEIKDVITLSLKTDIFALGKSIMEWLNLSDNSTINRMCADKPEDRPTLQTISEELKSYSDIPLPKLNRKENLVVKYRYALNRLAERIREELHYADSKYDSFTLKEWVDEVQKLNWQVFNLKSVKTILLAEIQKVVRYTNNIEELYAFVRSLRSEEFVNPILQREGRRLMWNKGMTGTWIKALDIIKTRAMQLLHELQSEGKMVDHPELYMDILKEKRARVFLIKSKRLTEFEGIVESQNGMKP